ncbi:MAG: DUF2125 domain-containing protein [Pseudomonadota bacterium]
MRGTDIRCDAQTVGGFPFRIGPRCQQVNADQAGPAGNVRTSVRTGSLTAEALLLDPGTVTVGMTSPISMDVAGQQIAAQWSDLEFTGNMNFNGGFDALLLNGSGIAFAQGQTTFAIGDLNGTLKPTPGTADMPDAKDVQATLQVKKASGSAPGVGTVPQLDLGAIITLHRSYKPLVDQRLSFSAFARKGFDFTIDELQLLTIGEGMLHLSGPVQVNPDGQMSGTLQIAIANPEALKGWTTDLPQEATQAIGILVQAVAGMGAARTVGGRTASSIEVTLDRGAVKLGFITMAQLPPLRF